jgi:hypothetical protein
MSACTCDMELMALVIHVQTSSTIFSKGKEMLNYGMCCPTLIMKSRRLLIDQVLSLILYLIIPYCICIALPETSDPDDVSINTLLKPWPLTYQMNLLNCWKNYLEGNVYRQ